MPSFVGLPDNRPEVKKELQKDVDFSMDTTPHSKVNWKGVDDYVRPTTEPAKVPSFLESGGKGSAMKETKEHDGKGS
jgi:hypothetical protein